MVARPNWCRLAVPARRMRGRVRNRWACVGHSSDNRFPFSSPYSTSPFGYMTRMVNPRKPAMVDRGKALCGRAANMRVTDRHAVNGTDMDDSFAGKEMARFG